MFQAQPKLEALEQAPDAAEGQEGEPAAPDGTPTPPGTEISF
jgi:hypothetical protein